MSPSVVVPIRRAARLKPAPKGKEKPASPLKEGGFSVSANLADVGLFF